MVRAVCAVVVTTADTANNAHRSIEQILCVHVFIGKPRVVVIRGFGTVTCCVT